MCMNVKCGVGLRLCILLCWSRGQSCHLAGQQGGVHRTGSAMLPERADCLAHQLALTHGEQADGSSSFGWKDNISCSWLFLRQVLLISGGQIQVFQGLDSAPGLCSPHCFKPLSVSVLHGRICAGKLLSTTVLPTCPASQPGWFLSWIVMLYWIFHCPYALGFSHGFFQAWVIKQANRVVRCLTLIKLVNNNVGAVPMHAINFMKLTFSVISPGAHTGLWKKWVINT